ncbi:craniofacial development protein 2-like [Schistocerca serialis cubense]|uniref:craniofacial development protein 2-like n=1 Tax=Schistocerca serialis cubense TaxID=2023355 RepID=UPI00214F0525|nr:craniofacial development protein 2-like [Schistocerca serialis cubense]
MERMSIKIMGIQYSVYSPLTTYSGIGIFLYTNVDDYFKIFCYLIKWVFECWKFIDGQFKSGVGFIALKAITECITNCVPVSERVMLLQISALPIQLNIIRVYAPTTDHNDEEVAEFYSQISVVLQQLPKKGLTIVLGGFNAKIGRGSKGDIIVHYGLDVRNERGELLSAFAGEYRFVITNTFFTLPPRHLYTWKPPRASDENITQNQINYVLINQRYRKSCLSMKTYPGADINSGHVPLVGVFKIRMKSVQKKKNVKMYYIHKPKESPIRENAESVSVTKKKSWMTEEMLKMVNRRREVKSNLMNTRISTRRSGNGCEKLREEKYMNSAMK